MVSNKLLGQHFLRCRWVLSTMLHAAELKKTDTVLEVGPGTGVLTRELAKHSKYVFAIEKDGALAFQLQDTLKREGIKNVKVVHEDILKMPLSKPSTLTAKRYKVVSNIPYYLTSRLIRLLLEGNMRPQCIIMTIQKEVAQRITARPPHMNLLALSVQAFGKPEIVKTVPKSCFSPQPKIDSAIIKIADVSDRFFTENSVDQKKFFDLLRRAFSQKRKMLRHSLSRFRLYSEYATKRPEELSLKQWANIIIRANPSIYPR